MAAEFRLTRRVAFAETDMAGVLHFSNYFRLMEEVEHAFWRALGGSVVHRAGDRIVSWPRVDVQCHYEQPARFEDQLELILTVARIGGKSLEFEVAFVRGTQRIATGRMTTVCCEVTGDGFRAIAIPEDLRAQLSEGPR